MIQKALLISIISTFYIVPVSCMNEKKDGDEEDVDCGGSCDPCGQYFSL